VTPASVTQLGYLGFESPAGGAWDRLAAAVGFEPAPLGDGGVALRMDDDRWARITIEPTSGEGSLKHVGWEVAGRDEFRAMCDQLLSAGVDLDFPPGLAAARRVEDVVTFADPSGIPSEIFWGARCMTRTPFQSPHGTHFTAGALGVGHIVVQVPDFVRARDFYTDVLGFKISEIIDVFGRRLIFLRCNPRHHAIALEESGDGALHLEHFMVELDTLDGLGVVRDRVIAAGIPLEMDIGRHPTDGAVSIYLEGPDSFFVEIGWGSYLIDDQTWAVVRHQRTARAWGHRRVTGANARDGDDG
jgi:2,3-dihydroxybiphenyl 1,2-dioxygenase